MTDKQTEALKLALEALEQIAAYRPLTFAECSDAEAVMRIAENAIPYLQEALAEQPAQQEPVNKYCCHLCFNKSGQMFLDRMILCPECGNKRCPKATYHELPCTNSNDPGQPGSIYTSPPASKPWVGLTEDEKTEIRREHYARTLPLMDAVEAKLREKNA